MSELPPPAAWVTHPWVAAGSERIRFGVSGGPRADWPALLEFVHTAEALGVDSFWMADHPLRENTPECWTLLAALAVSTKTIRLGSLVSCIYYRAPALLARQAADVDRMSNGRLVLGLGIGDYRWEFDKFCLPMPPVRERQQALAEAIHLIRGLWGDTPVTCQGRHFQVAEALIRPAPPQQPRVPLLIAGGGERVTLRQVAQYADMSNFGAGTDVGSAFTLEDVRRKFTVLRAHCAQRSRAYDSVLRSNWTVPICASTPAMVREKLNALSQTAQDSPLLVAGTPHDLVAHYQALVDAGMRYFTTYISAHDVDTMRLFAEQVIPALVVPPAVES